MISTDVYERKIGLVFDDDQMFASRPKQTCVARAVVVDSIVLALIPPFLALALIWSVREFQRQRQ